MQSSIQNFRYGQLNFQSSIQQATLNGALNVFVTAGFGGLDISDLAAFGAGFLAAPWSEAFWGPPVRKRARSPAGSPPSRRIEASKDTNPLNPGPPGRAGVVDRLLGAAARSWQHGGAVIMLSEFYDIQDFLAETGSHAWFPKSGFDRVVERRTSAYDDANFPLLDIGHIGPKGFWLFGKVVHPAPPRVPPGRPRRATSGVFSNKRPEWLTRDVDPYAYRLEGGDRRRRRQASLERRSRTCSPTRTGTSTGRTSGSSRSAAARSSAASRRSWTGCPRPACTPMTPVTWNAPTTSRCPGGGSDRLRLTNGDARRVRAQRQAPCDRPVPKVREPVRAQRAWSSGGSEPTAWSGTAPACCTTSPTARHPVRVEATGREPGRRGDDRRAGLHLRTTDQEMEAFTVLDRHRRHRLPAGHHRPGGCRRTRARGHRPRRRMGVLRRLAAAQPRHGPRADTPERRREPT